ncbi:DUF2953 domain-containing protein [Butyrivibrio sp. AE2032]|uniref:DUF2953 domain-containing protein n=1 Tax=Butyrivibrio sp. AE2032 TaxID=1458463 RepID=UPI0005537BAF|nr:DUF2953 domain-containing protein [Butyrivibrio sp. AE2032]
MLLTVLSVLKIIGIVLLIILAVILALVLLVLFVPIFYRVDATVPETEYENGFDPETVTASSSFSWLWFVIRGGIEYPKNKEFTLRVCGIKILPKKNKPEKAEEEKPEDQVKDDSDGKKPEGKTSDGTEGKADSAGKTDDQTSVTESEGTSTETETEPASVDQGGSGTENTADSSFNQSSSNDFWEEDDDSEDEPKSILDVIWKIIDFVDNFLKTPLNVFEKIQCTISRVCDKISMIKATLENDIFKRAFELVKRKLIWVLKQILPRKCDIKVLFGSGDPALTAELMGAYGALYPLLYKKVVYTPDFERKVVKGDVHLKGHLSLYVAVYVTVVCLLNKDVKKTIRRFKKIVNS